MEVPRPSPKAELLVTYVFQKVGPKRAPRFVPLLRKFASEGREVHGTRFSLQDVEDAIRLSGIAAGAPGSGNDPLVSAHVPTPLRAGTQPRMSDPSVSASASAVDLRTEAAGPAAVGLGRQPSVGELQHSASSGSLGQEGQPGAAGQEKASVSLRGTRVDIRANPPRLCELVKRAAAHGELGEPERKRRKGCSVDEEVEEAVAIEIGLFGVPRLLPGAAIPRQTLRISAGRAAAAAGIHPFTDVGELFLEFVYQDLPDLLLRDAALAGVEAVSPLAERAKLMAKSGESQALEAALRRAAAAEWVQGAQEAQRAVGRSAAAARDAGRLTAEEAEELHKMLDMEINLEFGTRHEDAAIDAYSKQTGSQVFGQQRRVSLALPVGGPAEALAHTLPPPRAEPLARQELGPTEVQGAQCMLGDQVGQGGVNSGHSAAAAVSSDAYFRLTGFVDGLVDLPRAQSGHVTSTSALETLVVEVKHRIGKIKDPPNIYDVVQLCCYCRVFGLRRGHLVQCLREEPSQPSSSSVGHLHVSPLDFSVGSEHRKGWDEHVLPSLYRCAAAVYAARADQEVRLRLLVAPTPRERAALVGSLCPHLER